MREGGHEDQESLTEQVATEENQSPAWLSHSLTPSDLWGPLKSGGLPPAGTGRTKLTELPLLGRHSEVRAHRLLRLTAAHEASPPDPLKSDKKP